MTDLTARTQYTEGGCSRAPSLTDRITEILLNPVEGNGVDRIYLNFNGYRLSSSTGAHFARLIAAAAEEHYRPKIETPEQLDALPVGSVIKIGELPGGLYEKDRSGSWGYDCWGDEYQQIIISAELEAKTIRALWSPGAGE